MSNQNRSILAIARADGYRQGWSQAAQVAHEDAYHQGVVDTEWRLSSEHKRWWAFGMLCGIAVCALWSALV